MPGGAVAFEYELVLDNDYSFIVKGKLLEFIQYKERYSFGFLKNNIAIKTIAIFVFIYISIYPR